MSVLGDASPILVHGSRECVMYSFFPCKYYRYTVVSRVSTHGRLNITRDFGPHGRLPGIKIPYICIEAATVTL